ncbi:MAG TPA: hypothetical protein VLG50_07770 [Candidatus Saccharimonadales bacterium]|nr:hypothetical protein [Candidatus Saccharimonadales bacterium]
MNKFIKIKIKMGIVTSSFELINSSLYEEVITKSPDGTIVTKRKNPWVAGISAAGAIMLLIVHIDGGTGMVSKVFGKIK